MKRFNIFENDNRHYQYFCILESISLDIPFSFLLFFTDTELQL